MEILSIVLLIVAILVGLFAAYNLLHYILFYLATHPADASRIGHELNEFERRQLVEWRPKAVDFFKHDDENRTYDDVFGPYRSEFDNYSTCVFPAPGVHRPLRSRLHSAGSTSRNALPRTWLWIRRRGRLHRQPCRRPHHLRDEFARARRHLPAQVRTVWRPASMCW